MQPAAWKRLLWQLLGLLFYAAGMVIFLVVMIGVYTAPPERSIENLSGVHVPYLLLSLLLVTFGGYVSRRFGARTQSAGGLDRGGPRGDQSQSTLERLGYVVPNDDEEALPYDYEDGVVYVTCAECGTRNEQEYDFCSDCAARLPS